MQSIETAQTERSLPLRIGSMLAVGNRWALCKISLRSAGAAQRGSVPSLQIKNCHTLASESEGQLSAAW